MSIRNWIGRYHFPMDSYGTLIRDARLAAHVKQADFAARLGMTAAQLCKIEKGGSKPSMRTMDRVAEALDMPVADLLSRAWEERSTAERAEPQSPKVAADELVSVWEGQPVERIPADSMRKILETEGEYSELELAFGIPSATLVPLVHPFVTDERGAEITARMVRIAIGAGSTTFADLAGLLEFNNVRIHLVEMPDDMPSCSFFNPRIRTLSIVLKCDDTPERQTNRIAYELGLACLFGSTGFQPLADTRMPHRFARQFSAAFLMPDEAVRLAVRQTGLKPKDWTYEAILPLKVRFNVSAEAFALRLERLNLINPAIRASIREQLRRYYAAHPSAMEPQPNLPPLPPDPRLEILRLRFRDMTKGFSKGNK